MLDRFLASPISAKHHLWKHETKRNVLIKFILILLVFLGYFFFIAYKYGLEQGFLVSVLTWSFFVLCTPIADAGFLLDFPLRLITGIKMSILEIFVWLVAISLNIYAFFWRPELYEKTKLLYFFKHILEQPWPFWTIILLSATGTFLSIRFGDELLDKTHHHQRRLYQQHKNYWRWLIMIFLFVTTLVLYDFLLQKMGLSFLKLF